MNNLHYISGDNSKHLCKLANFLRQAIRPFLLLLCIIFLASGAATAQLSGTTGGCSWAITVSGSQRTLTISKRSNGDGKMEDYGNSSSDSRPWDASRDELQVLVIQDGVTQIGNYAFYKCSKLTCALSIPASVTAIGTGAFEGCSGLTGAPIIPAGATSIAGNIFRGCKSLTGALTIPSGVTSIGARAFEGCSGLTGTLTIPSGMTSIGIAVFSGCSGLTGKLTIPSKVTSIGDNAFYGCSKLTGTLTIPSGVTSIGSNAFNGCSGLTGALTIPSGVTYIGSGTFSGCSGLTGALTIPSGVTSIYSNTFENCSGLTNVTIPRGVTNINSSAFENCSNLTSVSFPLTTTTIESWAFGGCTKIGKVTCLSLTPPKISSAAFDNVILSAITLSVPSSVLSKYQAANTWKSFKVVDGGLLLDVTVNKPALGSVSGTTLGLLPASTAVSLTATPKSGYNFADWTNEDNTVVSTNPHYSFLLTSDVKLSANFYMTIIEVGSATVAAKTYDGGVMAKVTSVTFRRQNGGGSITLAEGDYSVILAYFDSPSAGSNKTLTIKVKLTTQGAGKYELSADTYTLTTGFTISPAPLTVTPKSGQTKGYGASDPTLTYTASGWEDDEDMSLLSGALSRVAGENVGEYNITQGSLKVNSSNYTITLPGDVKFAVKPVTLTITPTSGLSKAYGASDPTLSYAASGWKGSDGVSLLSGALSRVAGESVGEYKITQGSLKVSNSNYTITFTGDVKFAIKPATLTITPTSGQSKEYGDYEPVLTYAASGWKGNDGNSLLVGTLSRDAGENAGEYKIVQGKLKVTDDNYTISFTGDVKFTIKPAMLTITPVSGQSKEYGASNPPLAYTTSGWKNGETTSLLSGALSRDAGEDVGEYKIIQGKLKVNNSNYAVNFTGNVKFAINPAELTITPVSGQSKAYGAVDPVLTYAASGWKGSDGVSLLSGALSRGAGEAVGEYKISQGSLKVTNGNYTMSFTDNVKFSIQPATITITPNGGQSKEYGNNDPVLTYAASGWKGSDGVSLLSGALSRDAGENVGEYKIGKGSLKVNNSNYTMSFTGDVKFAINPAPITITPTSGLSKTYGASDPPLTYAASGWKNGETVSLLSGALNRDAGENVGEYKITQGNLKATGNYAISFTGDVKFAIKPATLTITPDGGQSKTYGASDPVLTYTANGWKNGETASLLSGALSRDAGENVGEYKIIQGNLKATGNYAISFTGNIKFAIKPATLTITPDGGQSKTYGAIDPVLTYAASGWKNGETVSLLSGALSRDAGENVGEYKIIQGGLKATGNYAISFTGDVKFAIKPATLTITPDSGQSKTYGASDPVLTYAASGWKNGETVSLLSGALSRDAGENVGEYKIIQGGLKATGNYAISFTDAVKFSIKPATLTITPDSGQSKTYGAIDPVLTYTASGWKNGETASLLSGALSRDAGENVGEYKITRDSLKATGNYTISFTDDVKFAINPATLTITPDSGQSKTYGEIDPVLTYAASGWKNGETDSLLSGALSRDAGENAGEYKITRDSLKATGNYTISFADDVKFAINPATLTITPDSGQSKEYGEIDPVLTYAASGWKNGETDSLLSGALERESGENVGTYGITQGSLSAGNNYTIDFVGDVKFAIYQKESGGGESGGGGGESGGGGGESGGGSGESGGSGGGSGGGGESGGSGGESGGGSGESGESGGGKFSYTVTFDSKGGSPVPAQTILRGSKVQRPDEPKKQGYRFGGWYDDATLATPWNFRINTVTGNVILYAKWFNNDQSTFFVDFDSRGGTYVVSQEVESNGVVARPRNPTLSNYTFDGWYRSEAFRDLWDFDENTVVGNITLYAKWTVVSLQLDSMLINGVPQKLAGNNIYYAVPCHDTTKTLQISLKLPSGVSSNSPDNVLNFSVSTPSRRDTVITLSSLDGQKKEYTLTVEKMFEFDSIIHIQLGGRLMMVIKNPKHNGGFDFQDVRWERKVGGHWISTGSNSFYYVSPTDQPITDTMRILLQAVDNTWLTSCPNDPMLANAAGEALQLAVFPNPVAAGKAIRLKEGWLTDEKQEQRYETFHLYNAQGQLVVSGSASTLESGLTMPKQPGMYYLIFDGKTEKTVVRIAVVE
jgi:uncharacterized repeat protein (TIGR02543 family)